MWRNTAFGDEALYLWAGHLEVSHMLHGTAVPDFPTWFSGAAVIYQPIGAVADSLGGLAGARALSMLFMLGATLCLYGTTARLLSRRAALYTAALFVALGPTQALGAFATFDAMALFLLALATWFGVRSCALQGVGPRTALLLVAGFTIALADVTKYAAGIFNPIVVLLIALAYWQQHGFRAAVLAGLKAFAAWFVFIGIAILAGGHSYWQGVLFTTLARQSQSSPATLVLHESFNLVGPVIILALFALLASFGSALVDRLICTTAFVAILLAPLNQARIHTTVSLHKHVDFGALFGCIAAGYLLDRLSRVDTRRYWQIGLGLAAAIPIFMFGWGQAANLFSYWPNATGYIAALKPILDQPGATKAHYSIEEPWDVYYYLRSDVKTNELLNNVWDNTTHKELDGLAAVEQEIPLHYLSAVEIDETGNRAQDAEVESLLAASGSYELIYSSHWTYEGQMHKIEVWRLKAGAND
jgi:4-amino-4-deoxy-L-arabinose transferase-like glycosyltransferase